MKCRSDLVRWTPSICFQRRLIIVHSLCGDVQFFLWSLHGHAAILANALMILRVSGSESGLPWPKLKAYEVGLIVVSYKLPELTYPCPYLLLAVSSIKI